MYSRVYLLYHTWGQVLWGALVGIILGFGWFTLTHLMLTPLFPIVASWKVCETLMIRDTSLIPNILWFEYTHARTENRARSRKLASMKSQ
ncbi:putative dolichyldiphosphatase 1-like [Penaeus vannamei]|uniref:Putative dolichyldiphosphatase 1-like n=2 Tax=Penaeus TaxID=133894 RepID=A0A423SRV6_PENVA|nr:putative dolichyldiphosphatase 1-like [Penaeus vannamei]